MMNLAYAWLIDYLCLFLIGAIFDRERGNDGRIWWFINDRWPTSLGMGAVMAIAAADWPVGLITCLGYFFYISFGWGSYFIEPADFRLERFTGSRMPEIEWIDNLTEKLPPYLLLQNTAAWLLRNAYGVPTFIFLTLRVQSWQPLLYGLLWAFLTMFGYLGFAFIRYVTGWKFDNNSLAEGWRGGWYLTLIFAGIN